MKLLNDLYQSAIISKTTFESVSDAENYEHWEDGNFDDSFSHGQLIGSLDAIANAHGFISGINPEPSQIRSTVEALEDFAKVIYEKLSELDAAVIKQFEDRGECEGYVLVPGRMQRKITSEEEAVKTLASVGVDQDKLFDKKMIGIPAIEKILTSLGHNPESRSKILSGFISESVGNPSIKKA